MACAFSQIILESIRTWIASTQSIKVMGQIELRWIELDALCAWPALEEFLAIIFFERRREIGTARNKHSEGMTADEMSLLVALIVARWDVAAAARSLESLLSPMSARAAADAAARFRAALAQQAALLPQSFFYGAGISP